MLTPEEIIELNKDHPISLKYIQGLIDRVSARYPFVSKYEIAIVIKCFFEKLREILASGESISINGLFSHMHLIYFSRVRREKYHLISKVKLTTPEKMKR